MLFRSQRLLIQFKQSPFALAIYTCWFWHHGKRKGRLLELYQKPLSQLPFPELTPRAADDLLQFARQAVLNNGVSDQQNLYLHQITAQLFKLTPAESDAVWAFSQARQ